MNHRFRLVLRTGQGVVLNQRPPGHRELRFEFDGALQCLFGVAEQLRGCGRLSLLFGGPAKDAEHLPKPDQVPAVLGSRRERPFAPLPGRAGRSSSAWRIRQRLASLQWKAVFRQPQREQSAARRPRNAALGTKGASLAGARPGCDLPARSPPGTIARPTPSCLACRRCSLRSWEPATNPCAARGPCSGSPGLSPAAGRCPPCSSWLACTTAQPARNTSSSLARPRPPRPSAPSPRRHVFGSDRLLEADIANLSIIGVLVGDLLCQRGGELLVVDHAGNVEQALPQSQAFVLGKLLVVVRQFLQARDGSQSSAESGGIAREAGASRRYRPPPSPRPPRARPLCPSLCRGWPRR